MVVSVQRVAEKKVRRLVSDSVARRSRLPIGVNVGSVRRVWYLGGLEMGQFAHLRAICEGVVAVLVLVVLRKKKRQQGLKSSFLRQCRLRRGISYRILGLSAKGYLLLTKATIQSPRDLPGEWWRSRAWAQVSSP